MSFIQHCNNRLHAIITVVAFFVVGTGFNPISGQQVSLLWEITGNGLNHPSYLFGTIHIIAKKDFFMTQVVKEKFIGCRVLATEVDLNMPLAKKIEIAKKTFLPDGKTLEDYMEPGEFQLLRIQLQEQAGIKKKNMDRYIKLKPFFLSSIILQEQMGKTKSYEEEFIKMAKKNKMATLGLESIDYQLNIIDKVTIEDQLKMLKDGMDKDSKGVSQFDEMNSMYKKEEVDKLYELILRESAGIPNFKQEFLDERNRNWIPVIIKVAKNQPAFFAVGAAHLWGQTGVIQLLQDIGYTVHAVR